MRWNDVLSGVLLIISIANFAIAAPVSLQARVDVVHIPKDAVTVLGKRMDEDLENLKMVAQFLETTIKTAESSDVHASSSSAPLGTEHGSTNVVQASEPNPASPTANPGLTIDPPSPPSTAPVEDWWKGRAAWYDTFSSQASDKSDEPLPAPGSSGYGSDHESMEDLPKLNPISVPRPASTGADPKFDWDYWNKVVNEESPPKLVGQVHGNPNPAPSTGADPEVDFSRPGGSNQSPPKDIHVYYPSPAPPKDIHSYYPNPAPSTGAAPDKDFDWDYWSAVVNESPPKEVGHAHGYPDPGQSAGTGADSHWNNPSTGNAEGLAQLLETGPPTRLTTLLGPHRMSPTKLDEHPDLMAANQPPLYPPPPTEFEDGDVNRPFPQNKGKEKKLSDILSDLPSQGEFDTYLYPGTVAPPRWAGARLPTVSEHELAPPPLPDTGSPKTPLENEKVESPPPLDLGPLEEPVHEVIPGPPPSPNPEFHSDDQSPSTPPIDMPAIVYAAKGKSIQSRGFSGTARDVENPARRELQAAERSLDPEE
jgi:hypothetical protein